MADFPHLFRTTKEENTRGEDKIETQGELKTEVHKTILHKNNATIAAIRLVLTIYNHVQPEIKFAQSLQNVDILQRSAKGLQKVCRSDHVNFLQNNLKTNHEKKMIASITKMKKLTQLLCRIHVKKRLRGITER